MPKRTQAELVSRTGKALIERRQGRLNEMTEIQKIVRDKFLNFAVRIVNLKNELNAKHEYNIADQIQRSGTSLGAMQREAYYAESNDDMIHKLRIALKEANETQYWLELLLHTQYITEEEYKSLQIDLEELRKILAASVTKLKKTITT